MWHLGFFIFGIIIGLLIWKRITNQSIKIKNRKPSDLEWITHSFSFSFFSMLIIALSAWKLPDFSKQLLGMNSYVGKILSALIDNGFFAPLGGLLFAIIFSIVVKVRGLDRTEIYYGNFSKVFLSCVFFTASVPMLFIGIKYYSTDEGKSLAAKAILWMSFCIGSYVGFEYKDKKKKIRTKDDKGIKASFKRCVSYLRENLNRTFAKRILLVFIPVVLSALILYMGYSKNEEVDKWGTRIIVGYIAFIIVLVSLAIIDGRKECALLSRSNTVLLQGLEDVNGKILYYKRMKYRLMVEESKLILTVEEGRIEKISAEEYSELTSWEKQLPRVLEESIGGYYNDAQKYLEELHEQRINEMNKAIKHFKNIQE